MIKINVRPEVEQALAAAFPLPKNSAKRALAKYVKTLEGLVCQALMHGQSPVQRKLGAYSISLQRLANLGGQIGENRKRVHAWLRENGLELVRTVTQGSNLTGKISDVKLTELVVMTEEWDELEEPLSVAVSGCMNTAERWSPDEYDALQVNQKSLQAYIQWLTDESSLMKVESKSLALRQARTILATAISEGGWYYQRKRPSFFGRIYYEGTSIQNVNKQLRSAILGDCWEYDIRSSVISWKMGFAKSVLAANQDGRTVREAFSVTTGYLEDKADFMRTMRHFTFLEGTNVPKELQTKLLKAAVTAISFGARATTTGWYDMTGAWKNSALVDIIKNSEERKRFLGDATIRKFIQEQNCLDNYIFNHFQNDAGDILTSPFLQTSSGRLSKSKVLAFYYQQSETQVMNVLREVAASHGRKPLANVHDAVFFRNRLGADLKSEIEMEIQEKTMNHYWRLESTQLFKYTSVSKDVLLYEAEHKARLENAERRAAGCEFSSTVYI
ncbi:hypothetical protein [Limnohabitans sp. INBF002]|uniref:hypothetical protein n=1 Tax=Limnohabitans sp. INBF002 TaxID=2986280 RepID=UPI002376DB90|nr:hypothetical protein [Limnohabitans sp. INBF002]BDU53382.1 hypothetical protein LINBF2_16170 [Limnohabitans sp. INBF002]